MLRKLISVLVVCGLSSGKAFTAESTLDSEIEAGRQAIAIYLGCARNYAKSYASTPADPDHIAEAALAACSDFLSQAQDAAKMRAADFESVRTNSERRARREAIKTVLEARYLVPGKKQ